MSKQTAQANVAEQEGLPTVTAAAAKLLEKAGIVGTPPATGKNGTVTVSDARKFIASIEAKMAKVQEIVKPTTPANQTPRAANTASAVLGIKTSLIESRRATFAKLSMAVEKAQTDKTRDKAVKQLAEFIDAVGATSEYQERFDNGIVDSVREYVGMQEETLQLRGVSRVLIDTAAAKTAAVGEAEQTLQLIGFKSTQEAKKALNDWPVKVATTATSVDEYNATIDRMTDSFTIRAFDKDGEPIIKTQKPPSWTNGTSRVRRALGEALLQSLSVDDRRKVWPTQSALKTWIDQRGGRPHKAAMVKLNELIGVLLAPHCKAAKISPTGMKTSKAIAAELDKCYTAINEAFPDGPLVSTDK